MPERLQRKEHAGRDLRLPASHACGMKLLEEWFFMSSSDKKQTKVFQILVDNNSGVLSRIAGLFSRRGYNIESITAGETADPRITRITIATSGDDDIMEQIEKQVSKLVDVRDIHELKPEESVYSELAMIKVRADSAQRENVIALTNIFRGNIIDVSEESLMIEITGNSGKVDAFIRLISGYEILEIARTGVAGLGRGTKNVIYIDDLRLGAGISDRSDR